MFKKLINIFRPRDGFPQGRWLHVRVDTTNFCNIRCRICPHSCIDKRVVRNETMEMALFDKVAADVFPIANRLSLSCSNEPLIAKNFPEFIEHASKYDVPVSDFFTNGVLLDEKVINVAIDCGVDVIYVSMDSADKETFEKIRYGAKFDRVVENLENLRDTKIRRAAAKPRLMISAVLCRSTIEGIEDLMRLAKRLGADGVLFRHFMPFSMLSLRDESLFFHKDLTNKHIARARKLTKELEFDTFIISEEFSDHASGDVVRRCNLKDKILIHHDGTVTVCDSLLYEDSVGDFKTQTFAEIWNAPEYKRMREDFAVGRLRPECSNCPAATSGGMDASAYSEFGPPSLELMVAMLDDGGKYDEESAKIYCRTLKRYYCDIKPEYDLEFGVTPEKLERWRKWYEASRKIREEFLKGKL